MTTSSSTLASELLAKLARRHALLCWIPCFFDQCFLRTGKKCKSKATDDGHESVDLILPPARSESVAPGWRRTLRRAPIMALAM